MSNNPILVAQGWNNSGGVARLSPQPSWTPGQYAQVNNALSSDVALIGRYYELVEAPGWDQTQYYALFTQLGLDIDTGVYSAPITVAVPNEMSAGYVYYNATTSYQADAKRKLGLFWQGSLWVKNMIPL